MKRNGQRPLVAVPRALWGALLVSVAVQIAAHAWAPSARVTAEDLPAPPRGEVLRLASFGEPEAMARLLMLYLQAFDLGGGNALPYQRLDYRRLVAWLETILALDPRSQYPLFSAARLYAETRDPQRLRLMLDFVYREYFIDPNRRWPWLAEAAILAKHRLHDLPLARRYAAAIPRHTTDPNIPPWARQMELFVLEDMGELEAERIMIGDLVRSGRVTDPAELLVLKQRLEELGQKEGRARPAR